MNVMPQFPQPAKSRSWASTGRSRTVRIDQRIIDRLLREPSPIQRVLVDAACPGMRLVFHPGGSNAWTYSYRPRGTMADGRRHPQRTWRIGDLSTHTPADARSAAVKAKAAVRNGGDPMADAKAAAEAARLAKLRQIDMDTAGAQYITSGLSGGTLHREHEARHLRLAIRDMSVGTMALTD